MSKPEKISFGRATAIMEREGNQLTISFTLPTDDPHPSTEEYFRVLTLMGVTHISKGADYGRALDPFSNVRSSEDFGIPGWVGSMVRGNDKMRRLQKASHQIVSGEQVNMANESIEDSLLDLGVYAGIGLVLLRESEKS